MAAMTTATPGLHPDRPPRTHPNPGLLLQVRPITTEAFAAYGWLIQAEGQAARPINGGSSLRVDGVGELSLDAAQGTPCLAVFRAQARDLAGPWRELERHRLGTQTFVPMGGAPGAAQGGPRCVVLVALGAQAPEPATLAAFLVNGAQAVTLHAGTWHHGLIALDAGDFLVIERRAALVDCELATLPDPVTLQAAR